MNTETLKSDANFEFIEFNKNRAKRNEKAVKMKICKDGIWLWMDKSDLENNIIEFGDDFDVSELVKGLNAYENE